MTSLQVDGTPPAPPGPTPPPDGEAVVAYRGRPVLIGASPGPSTLPAAPLFPNPLNSMGGRVCAMVGCSKTDYLACFDRLNLLAEYPGEKWPKKAAEHQAANLMASGLLEGRSVVFLGKAVWYAFGGIKKPIPFSAYRCQWAAAVFYCPHPSGANPVWNRKGTHETGRKFFQSLLRLSGHELNYPSQKPS